ncbi:SDR family NAD(P)-dependent oxidoreductase [Cohnella herbarum]|uniref:3-oxoacyl-ACP reductase FabG n=1 Tax=Cohnella herbarum TaxID=2728023 RepID=A0A7Z2VGU5_9BACL|nr:3-oxoacyl-ACP reductase family protein [Cohnella herbarum]QJD82797.1 3-oxoacyl-ACP reductase FabG [Cohnella herbarum]
MRLHGRTAIVTGAARSIGAAVAARYAAEGANVVIADIDVDEAERVAASIRALGGEAIAIGTDVSDKGQVERMVETTVRRFGTVDILVNNAGIDPRRDWLEMTGEEWDRVMGVNAKSQLFCAQAVFPHMRERGRGKIVNVSSVTFYTGQTGFVHYVASKGAIIGFTRALAREVGGHGITVNGIAPGAVLTETEGEDETDYDPIETEREMKGLQSIGRRQTAGDLEGAFVFLASEDSDFITGQTLNVNGGWILN